MPGETWRTGYAWLSGLQNFCSRQTSKKQEVNVVSVFGFKPTQWHLAISTTPCRSCPRALSVSVRGDIATACQWERVQEFVDIFNPSAHHNPLDANDLNSYFFRTPCLKPQASNPVSCHVNQSETHKKLFSSVSRHVVWHQEAGRCSTLASHSVEPRDLFPRLFRLKSWDCYFPC